MHRITCKIRCISKRRNILPFSLSSFLPSHMHWDNKPIFCCCCYASELAYVQCTHNMVYCGCKFSSSIDSNLCKYFGFFPSFSWIRGRFFGSLYRKCTYFGRSVFAFNSSDNLLLFQRNWTKTDLFQFFFLPLLAKTVGIEFKFTWSFTALNINERIAVLTIETLVKGSTRTMWAHLMRCSIWLTKCSLKCSTFCVTPRQLT